MNDLVITRTFREDVRELWLAWLDPGTLKDWWGPKNFTCPSVHMDFRPGGTTVIAMHNAQMGTFYSRWDYEAIEPFDRISYIHNLCDAEGNILEPTQVGMPGDFPTDQRHTILFKQKEEGLVEMTIIEEGWGERQTREFARLGMEQTLDKLEAMLSE